MSLPMRTCIGCAATDDHPRHVIGTPDGNEVTWHMDCHKIANGCEVCTAQIADAKGAKGEKLREHLLKTGPGKDFPGWTPPGLEGGSPGNSGNAPGNSGGGNSRNAAK